MKILTVLDSIGETNMPFNEFIRYRLERLSRTQEYLLVYSKKNEYRHNLLKIWSSNGSLLSFFKNSKKSLENCDIIHLHHPFSGVIFLIIKLLLKSRKKSIYTVHSNFPNYSKKAKILTIICFLLAEKITFVSQSGYDSLPEQLKKKLKNKATVIQNGVDTERLKNYKKENFKVGNTIRMITIGRMVEAKNHSFLLDLLKYLKDIELIFIGEGKFKKNLMNKLDEDGTASKVIFKGQITRENVYKELQESDLFLSTSLWEGMPIAALEALAIGVPIILSDIEAHKLIKKQIEDVDIVELSQYKWIEKIEKMISISREEKEKLMYKLQLETEEKFSLKEMNIKYLKLYKETLEA